MYYKIATKNAINSYVYNYVLTTFSFDTERQQIEELLLLAF